MIHDRPSVTRSDVAALFWLIVVATGMYLTLVERRTHDEPVAAERRHFAPVPRWLVNLKAKALDSWRAAA